MVQTTKAYKVTWKQTLKAYKSNMSTKHTKHMVLKNILNIKILLGSKDLGFYVFRTLICIVGKPWSKQCV